MDTRRWSKIIPNRYLGWFRVEFVRAFCFLARFVFWRLSFGKVYIGRSWQILRFLVWQSLTPAGVGGFWVQLDSKGVRKSCFWTSCWKINEKRVLKKTRPVNHVFLKLGSKRRDLKGKINCFAWYLLQNSCVRGFVKYKESWCQKALHKWPRAKLKTFRG